MSLKTLFENITSAVETFFGYRGKETEKFDGIELLSSPDALGDRLKIQGVGDGQWLDVYKRKNERKHLGHIQIKEVLYYFFEERLLRIRVETAESPVKMLMKRYDHLAERANLEYVFEPYWILGDSHVLTWCLHTEGGAGVRQGFTIESISGMREFEAWKEKALNERDRVAAASW